MIRSSHTERELAPLHSARPTTE